MSNYTNLDRRFRAVDPDKELDPEADVFFAGRHHGTLDWHELLEYRRIVILAEAGSGKTTEMEYVVREMNVRGGYAFFLPLEQLNSESIADILSAEDEGRYEAWKKSPDEPAWFFLDAVDELRLTQGTLDRALRRLAKDLHGLHRHVRLVISSRPSDWRPGMDAAALEKHFPRAVEAPLPVDPDEAFLVVLRQENSSGRPSANETPEDDVDALKTVVLLPFSSEQVRAFVEAMGVANSESFLAEVEKHDAWAFARRPLDLGELVSNWTRFGRLGTLRQQQDSNVTAKLRDRPDRPDAGVLDEQSALEGAQRLALSLTLTRTRTLLSPEESHARRADGGAVDPADVLPDWTQARRQALLRRALFDPATYGRIRFHHRSVQEYLAACRLVEYRKAGMSTKALFRLLFAEKYGVRVVIPSMRPIAAWTALWDDDVRNELIEREPQVLLTTGDPSSLTHESRAALLRRFADLYGKGTWHGLAIPSEYARRLASPDLTAVVRTIWTTAPTSNDMRHLLMATIRYGALQECADILASVAADDAGDNLGRVIAIRALAELQDKRLPPLVESMLSPVSAWPSEVVHNVAADIFPQALSSRQLVTLFERIPEPVRSTGGFGWVFQQIAQTIDVPSETANSLRDLTVDLVERGLADQQEFFRISSQFFHLVPGLRILCARQLAVAKGSVEDALIRASIVAARVRDENSPYESNSDLYQFFAESAGLRARTFLQELRFMDALFPTSDRANRLYHVQRSTLLEALRPIDFGWLSEVVDGHSGQAVRPVALHALLSSRGFAGWPPLDLANLRNTISGIPDLEDVLFDAVKPATTSSRADEIQMEQDRHVSDQRKKEAQRLANWRAWRAALIANPEEGFSPMLRAQTIQGIGSWLKAKGHHSNRLTVWDEAALSSAFGAEVTRRTKIALGDYWRENAPLPKSQRLPAERNLIYDSWFFGLSGLAAEASETGWATRLTEDEARSAAAFAMVEMNSLPPFLRDLALAHPTAVDFVIGGELSWELSRAHELDHLPLLQVLGRADETLLKILGPRLLNALRNWPRQPSATDGTRLDRHLQSVLDLAGDARNESDQAKLVTLCADGFSSDILGPLAVAWLTGLFRLDSQRAVDLLSHSLQNRSDTRTAHRAIEILASLFGHRTSHVLKVADIDLRARLLGRLLRLAYAFVRPENDAVHDGVYSPDTRDNAETARNFILSALLDTPGPTAMNVIRELADEPDFQHFPDRLRQLARERAATDAEFDAFTTPEVLALEKCHESPPSDRDGMFSVMCDRLADLQHEISHHDFVPRKTWRAITEEAEMQRTLAWQLQKMANGAYTIAREDEVADRKRVDIRFSSVMSEQKAVAEVKLAHCWSLSDFEEALTQQLAGQYLRHRHCKAGSLLITDNGQQKTWRNMKTGESLNFGQVLGYLRRIAVDLVVAMNHDVRIAVIGLDLKDPVVVR